MKNYQQEEKGLGPPKKNSKDWRVEYRWIDEKSFNQFKKDWYKEKFTTEFQPVKFGSRFTSLKGAQESIKNVLKTASSVTKGGIMYDYYRKDLFKEYRIVNTRTKEIVEYGDKTENTETSS